MTTEMVVKKFLDRRPGHGRSVATDGQYLLSYGVRVAEWTPRDVVVVSPVYYSKTTSAHVGLVCRLAASDGRLVVIGDVDQTQN